MNRVDMTLLVYINVKNNDKKETKIKERKKKKRAALKIRK
jgi:hypothetical protein